MCQENICPHLNDKKDPVQKPEDADISSSPSEEDSDEEVTILLSIKHHEEILQKNIEKERRTVEERNKRIRERKEKRARKEHQQEMQRKDREKTNEKAITSKTTYSVQNRRLAEKIPKTGRKPHIKGKMAPSVTSSNTGYMRCGGTPSSGGITKLHWYRPGTITDRSTGTEMYRAIDLKSPFNVHDI